MCLDKITKRYKPNEYKRGFGWKAFYVYMKGVGGVGADSIGYKESLMTLLRGNNKELTKGIFLNEKHYRHSDEKGYGKIEGSNGDYKYGWHIYLKRPNDGRTYEVEYKGGHTRGIDDCKKVIVAKYMKILE